MRAEFLHAADYTPLNHGAYGKKIKFSKDQSQNLVVLCTKNFCVAIGL